MSMMSTDQSPKTAYELAMERLRKKDADAGVASTPLTDEQKAAIAEARNFYDAKIAEQEILFQSRLRASQDPAEREALAEMFRRDRDRLPAHPDNKIQKLRK